MPILWSHPSDLNRRPFDYESNALPTELGWLMMTFAGLKLLSESSRIRKDSHPSEIPNIRFAASPVKPMAA